MPLSPVFEELLHDALDRQYQGERLAARGERIPTEDLVEVVRHGPVLEALHREPLDNRAIQDRLGVSRATSHRFTRWLDEHGLAERTDDRYHLTGKGEVFAEEVVRLEWNLRAAMRLAPLLDRICEDHKEFVIEPFADSTLTTADPGDPFRPMNRLVELVEGSGTLRGFYTGPLAPLSMTGLYDRLLGMEVELVSLPEPMAALLEAYGERVHAAMDVGRLSLYTRADLPYGLLVFDDRVAVAAYDEETGHLEALAESDAATAREWADLTYRTIVEDSEPLDPAEVPR